MITKRNALVAFLAFSLIAGLASATRAEFQGKVRHVGTYGSGTMFVVLDGTIGGPGCSSTRFELPKTHSQANRWLAIAQMAFVSDSTVTAFADTCFTDEYGVSYPSMSDTGGWFHLSR